MGTFLLSTLSLTIGTYLAATQYMADVATTWVRAHPYVVAVVESIIPPPPVVVQQPQEVAPAPTEKEPEAIADLPDGYEIGGAIPQILIDHAAVQIGTVAGASTAITLTPTTTTLLRDPKDALVNIFCTLKTKKYTRATTGSGVVISEKGIILTNAHVAQFLLLDDTDSSLKTECVVRTGSPAVAKYRAKLLYIPPLWVSANADQLNAEHPSGTGERDYALLYITESVTEDPVPQTFSYLTPRIALLTNSSKAETVTVGGYPAEKMLTEGVQSKLDAVLATTTIKEFYTFGSKQADLIALAPSAAGEQGTSGGLVTFADGGLVGLVATRGNVERDGARSLRAITLPYINRTIQEETGITLDATLRGNLVERARFFRTSLEPILGTIIENELR